MSDISNTDDISSVLAWLDQFQSIRPEGTDLPASAETGRDALQIIQDGTKDLPFDLDPTGFTLLLDQLARK